MTPAANVPVASFQSTKSEGVAIPTRRNPLAGAWRVVVEDFVIETEVGMHAHEHGSAQKIGIDASLSYSGVPSENARGLIDYDVWCTGVTAYLGTKSHTRLLEMLAVEIAVMSFDRWPALDSVLLLLYKPDICANARRVGVELRWTRIDYAYWKARNLPMLSQPIA